MLLTCEILMYSNCMAQWHLFYLHVNSSCWSMVIVRVVVRQLVLNLVSLLLLVHWIHSRHLLLPW